MRKVKKKFLEKNTENGIMSYIFIMCEIKKYKVIDGYKLCRKCNELLPVDKFGKNHRLKSGLHSHCKDCCNISKRVKNPKPKKVKEIPIVIKPPRKREIIDGKLYCKTCDTHHPVEMFNKKGDFYNSQCKGCQKITRRNWLLENREEYREYRRGYDKRISDEKREVRLKLKNELLQQKSIERDRIQREKDEIKRLKDEQYQYEKEQRDIQRKLKVEEYRNSEKYKQLRRERNKRKFNNRIQRDPLYKFRKSLGNSIRNSFRRGGFTKSSRSYDILGEEWEVIKVHFESRFTPGMSWDNYGEWHIDHILPISLATCEEDVIRLNHYTNLQPLWAKDNLLKSDNILIEYFPISN